MLKFTCCDAVQQFFSGGQAQVLRGITRGYERECLRVDAAAFDEQHVIRLLAEQNQHREALHGISQ